MLKQEMHRRLNLLIKEAQRNVTFHEQAMKTGEDNKKSDYYIGHWLSQQYWVGKLEAYKNSKRIIH